MRLKNEKQVQELMDAVQRCSGDVIVRTYDNSEEYNLKSRLSRFVAIGELCTEHGEDFELFCADRADEPIMIRFFRELQAA